MNDSFIALKEQPQQAEDCSTVIYKIETFLSCYALPLNKMLLKKIKY